MLPLKHLNVDVVGMQGRGGTGQRTNSSLRTRTDFQILRTPGVVQQSETSYRQICPRQEQGIGKASTRLERPFADAAARLLTEEPCRKSHVCQDCDLFFSKACLGREARRSLVGYEGSRHFTESELRVADSLINLNLQLNGGGASAGDQFQRLSQNLNGIAVGKSRSCILCRKHQTPCSSFVVAAFFKVQCQF